jgi:hypothetical protein
MFAAVGNCETFNAMRQILMWCGFEVEELLMQLPKESVPNSQFIHGETQRDVVESLYEVRVRG